MPNNKEIRFNATLDDTQITQAIANITQKMKAMQGLSTAYAQMAKGVSGGQLPMMSPQTQQAFDQAFKRQSDSVKQFYMDQANFLNKAISQQSNITKELNDQLSALGKLNRESKEYEETQERIAQLKKDQLNADEEVSRLFQVTGKAANAANLPSNISQGPTMMGSILQAASVGTVVAAAKEMGDWFTRRQVEVSRLQGSAIAGTTGTVLSQLQSGQFAYEGMFGEERERAAQTAKTAENRGRGWDIAQLVGGAGLMIGGVALAATGIGAGLGAGAFASGAAMMYGKRNMLDKDKYEAEKATQFADDFNSTFQAEKDKSAFKKDAIEKLQSNASSYLNYQRALNLSDSAMFANFGNITRAGFTDQMGMQAANAILEAGGSTAMANNSEISLKAQRQLGLTNSNQLLGMISGTQGIPETSKKTLIDIFAQGQSIGLDSSKYAQENRQFMQNVAESISRGGTTSESAADTIAKIMGAFTGGATTIKGVEQGKEAYETFQKNASQTSGYQGAINMASLLSSNPAFRKIRDPAILQGLASLKPEEIDPDDPYIQSAAASMGTTPKALADMLVNQKTGAVGKGLARGAALTRFANKEKKWKETHGGTLLGFDQDKNNFGDSDFASLVSMHQVLNPGESLKAAEASIRGLGDLSTMTDQERLLKFKKQTAEQLETGDTGRGIDKIVSASAKNAQTALDTLSKSIDNLAEKAINASNAMSNSIERARSAHTALDEAQSSYSRAKDKLGSDIKAHASLGDVMEDQRALSRAAANRNKMQEAATAADKAVVSSGNN